MEPGDSSSMIGSGKMVGSEERAPRPGLSGHGGLSADPEGFDDLVAVEHKGLIAAATMIVGDPRRSEEIVQNAFERTWKRWPEVSKLDRPGAWVRRVVINEAISVTRRRGSERKALRRLMSRRRDHQSAPGSEPDRDGLWEAVGGLPENQAKVVALHYGADQSIEGIASEMELSSSAVKALLYRARTTLRSIDAVAQMADEHNSNNQEQS